MDSTHTALGHHSRSRRRSKRDSWEVGSAFNLDLYSPVVRVSKDTLAMIQQSLEEHPLSPVKTSALKSTRICDLTSDLLALASPQQPPKKVLFSSPLISDAHSLDDYHRLQMIRKLRAISTDDSAPPPVHSVTTGDPEGRTSIDSLDSGHFEEQTTPAGLERPRHKESLEELKKQGKEGPLLKSLLISRLTESTPVEPAGNGEISGQTLDSADIDWDDNTHDSQETTDEGLDQFADDDIIVDELEAAVDDIEIADNSFASVDSGLALLPSESTKLGKLRRTLNFVRIDDPHPVSPAKDTAHAQDPNFVMRQPNDSASSMTEASADSVALGRKTRSSIDIFKLKPLFRGLLRRPASREGSPRSSQDTSSSGLSFFQRRSSSEPFRLFRRTSKKSIESTSLKETMPVQTPVTVISEDSSDVVSIQETKPKRSVDSGFLRGLFASPASVSSEEPNKRKPLQKIRDFFARLIQ
ncbi:hypothetical protein HDU91_003388 [Kappamyces sp. JEL0680]|nr:hypothetical protein HDU91_003388 [Kappamyces sp. JEL0680]